jgi:hypothetical protein
MVCLTPRNSKFESEQFHQFMRNPTEFSAFEWLKFLPVQHALKEIRNDAWLALYKKTRADKLDEFLEKNKYLENKNIVLVIAFELPWVLNWLLQKANKNVTDMTVLVFDNSRDPKKRIEIEQVCNTNGAPYLALPANPTRHVNRSHGLAMTWVYYNVVRLINPRIFGFIDHDLIPVRKVTIEDKLSDQPVYGLVNEGKLGFWSLWAGYCFFDHAQTKGKSINFLYDFSRDLDTGGRNWASLYRELNHQTLRCAVSENLSLKGPLVTNPRLVQFIDQNWLHIGGISYSDNSREDIEFFKGLQKVFQSS